MENIKILHLSWKEYSYEEAFNLNDKDHYGIYQVYGDHPVYGRDSLIYIGKAFWQTFGKRFNTHHDFFASNIRFTKVCVGRLCKSEDSNKKNWESNINLIETILIISHYPAYNANGIKGLLESKDIGNVLILNWGEYGDLLPEISSLRWSNKYWEDNNDPENHILK
jgi:hypothetical protein